jgi:hypothetical protein
VAKKKAKKKVSKKVQQVEFKNEFVCMDPEDLMEMEAVSEEAPRRKPRTQRSNTTAHIPRPRKERKRKFIQEFRNSSVEDDDVGEAPAEPESESETREFGTGFQNPITYGSIDE